MYELRVYIYILKPCNFFGARQKFYGFKSLIKLEGFRAIFKITIYQRPSVRSLLIVIFLLNFAFFWLGFFLQILLTSNLLFFRIISNRFFFGWVCYQAQSARAKRAPRASGSSAVFVQFMQIKHVSCERNELCQPSRVFASKAQSKQIKHASCKRSKLRQPSTVLTNQLKQASKRSLRQLSEPIKLATRDYTADYDFPRILVVRKGGRKEGRNQKVALKRLKIRYV